MKHIIVDVTEQVFKGEQSKLLSALSHRYTMKCRNFEHIVGRGDTVEETMSNFRRGLDTVLSTSKNLPEELTGEFVIRFVITDHMFEETDMFAQISHLIKPDEELFVGELTTQQHEERTDKLQSLNIMMEARNSAHDNLKEDGKPILYGTIWSDGKHTRGVVFDWGGKILINIPVNFAGVPEVMHALGLQRMDGQNPNLYDIPHRSFERKFPGGFNTFWLGSMKDNNEVVQWNQWEVNLLMRLDTNIRKDLSLTIGEHITPVKPMDKPWPGVKVTSNDDGSETHDFTEAVPMDKAEMHQFPEHVVQNWSPKERLDRAQLYGQGVIYGFITFSDSRGVQAYACDHNGHVLEQHFCSSEGFAKSDLGFTGPLFRNEPFSEEPHSTVSFNEKVHRTYSQRYPQGYYMEWIGEVMSVWEPFYVELLKSAVSNIRANNVGGWVSDVPLEEALPMQLREIDENSDYDEMVTWKRDNSFESGIGGGVQTYEDLYDQQKAREMRAVQHMLRTGVDSFLAVEIVYDAMTHLKYSPEKSLEEAIQFSLDKWKDKS